jgi:glycosyltransferase involved in cell wall biosynthesis
MMRQPKPKADLVAFGEDWGRHPSSTQHLMKRIGIDRQVLWVNSIGMRRPHLTLHDLNRAASKVFGGPSNPSTALPGDAPRAGTTITAPFAISWPGSRAAFALNRRLLARQIGARMTERGIKRPVLWTSLPTALPVVGTLGERAVVYYCGDDFGALAGVDHEPVLAMERRLVEKADLVLAASAVLAARFPSHKTLHVPHGADIALFQAPAPRAADLPSDKPVAGFYGSLSSWIDTELMATVADLLPDWWFVFIGGIETDVSILAARPNVRLLGKRAHSELPGYAQHWMASLLPFRDNAQIRACNPLKLREYMAVGRPIVATDFPALGPYRDLISVAAAPGDFAAAVAATLQGTDRTRERQVRVQSETWEARAAQVEHALEQL